MKHGTEKSVQPFQGHELLPSVRPIVMSGDTPPPGEDAGITAHGGAKFAIGFLAGVTAVLLPRLLALLSKSDEGQLVFFPFSYYVLAAGVGLFLGLVMMVFEYRVAATPKQTFMSGLEALEAVRPAFESSPIVVLSGEDDPRQVRRAIDAGAAGFIPKSSTPDVLCGALRLVLANEVYLPAVALRGIDQEEGAGGGVASGRLGDALSERQVDVLRKAVQGKANKVIARELVISESTVKAHLSAAFRALGVHNRTEAVYVAARCGLRLKP